MYNCSIPQVERTIFAIAEFRAMGICIAFTKQCDPELERDLPLFRRNKCAIYTSEPPHHEFVWWLPLNGVV